MTRHLALSTAVSLAFWCGPVSSSQAKEPATADLALFPLVAKGKPNPEIIKAFSALLDSTSSWLKDKTVLTCQKMKARPGKNPCTEISRCKDLACVAALGKKVKTRSVFYGRAEPLGKGVKIRAVIVNAATAAAEGKVAIDIRARGEVAKAVSQHFQEIFGVPFPGAAPRPTAEEEPALVLAPIVSETPAPPAPPVPPTGPVAAASPVVSVTPPVATAAPDAGTTPILATSVPPTVSEPAPTSSEPTLAFTPLTPPTSPSGQRLAGAGPGKLYTYSSIGLAGVGAVLVGVGGFFGYRSTSLGDQIEPSTDLPRTVDLSQQANSAASRANTLFLAGGGTLAVGAVMLGLRYLVPSWFAGGAAPAAEVSTDARSGLTW